MSRDEGFACVMLQSKGSPLQAISLDPGSKFTVHQPWHEVEVPGCELPVVLVYCATPGHVSELDTAHSAAASPPPPLRPPAGAAAGAGFH